MIFKKSDTLKEKNMKRIAILIPELYCGGIERVAGLLSIYFVKQGYSVIFFVNKRKKEREFPHAGKVIDIDQPLLLTSDKKSKVFLSLVYQIYRIRQMKKKYSIDVTISFHGYMNVVSLLSGMKDKKILTIHEVTSFNANKLRWFYYHPWVFRYLFTRADKIVAVSEYCRKDLIKNMGVEAGRVTVIRNPIDKCDAVSKAKEIPRETFAGKAVLAVGRLEEDKQFEHVIRAFQTVAECEHSAVLFILGEGRMKSELKKLVRKMHLEKHIRFLGFQENVYQYMARASCLVFCSETEALPCAVIEAFLTGLPVVAADCRGGLRELLSTSPVHTKRSWQYVTCGILVPEMERGRPSKGELLTKAEQKLAEGILELLKNEPRRQELSKNCRMQGEKYTLETIGALWDRLLESL